MIKQTMNKPKITWRRKKAKSYQIQTSYNTQMTMKNYLILNSILGLT